METISAKEMKKWAKDTLPPMAWQRVTFRILPQLNQMNVFLHSFEEDNYLLNEDVFKMFDTTFLEIFGKQFAHQPTQIVAPTAIETLAFVPTVVPVEQPIATPAVITPTNVPLTEELKAIVPSDLPLVEKLEAIFSVDAPLIQKAEAIFFANESKVKKVEEIVPVVTPIVEKVEQIVPVIAPIVEKVEEIVPVVAPVAEIKEEKKEPEKPIEKPFVSIFSLEQLQSIFGKK